jgi:hypothetical protein
MPSKATMPCEANRREARREGGETEQHEQLHREENAFIDPRFNASMPAEIQGRRRKISDYDPAEPRPKTKEYDFCDGSLV